MDISCPHCGGREEAKFLMSMWSGPDGSTRCKGVFLYCPCQGLSDAEIGEIEAWCESQKVLLEGSDE